MGIPQYTAFFDDLQKIYDSYNAEEFSAGSEEDTRWRAVLTAMSDLIEKKTGSDEETRQKAWNNLLEKISLCHVHDLSNCNLNDNDSQEVCEEKMAAFNKEFAKNDSQVPRWRLHRLKETLFHQLDELCYNEKLQSDRKKMGNYIRSYSDILDDVDSFGTEIDEFDNYDKFYKTFTDALNNQQKMQLELKEALENADTTPEIEKYNISKLKEVQKELILKREAVRREIREFSRKIEEKEDAIAAANKEAEEVKASAAEIEAEHQRQQEILKKKETERNAQALLTKESIKKAEDVSAVISEVKQKSFEADQKVEKINKDYNRTKGVSGVFRTIGGLFSKKIREEDARAKKDHEALSWLQDQENSEKFLQEAAHAFDELIRPEESFESMLKIGEFIHNNEKIGSQMLKNDTLNQYNRRCEKVYLTRERLKNDMLQRFSEYQPNETAMKKFDERMQTKDGIIRMAEELRDLAAKDVENKLEDSDIKENMQNITGILEAKKASEKIAANSEEEIAGMQNDMLHSGNALRSREEAVKDQKKTVKDSSLESKLEVSIAKQKAEADKLTLLGQEKYALDEKMDQKRTELDSVNAQITHWGNILNLRERLDRKTTEVEKHRGLYNKISNYMGKCNQLVKDGGELKKQLRIDKQDKYGEKYTSDLAVDTYLGLNALYKTALVGKENGHLDTPAYRGMMDGFDRLMKDRGAALNYLSLDELKQHLADLKTGAENYITAKNNQRFASLRHSPMRKARLDFANKLIDYCNKQTDAVNDIGTKIGRVQNLYDNFVKTGVNGWKEPMSIEDAFAGIKESRKTKLDLSKNKEHQTYKTKVRTIASDLLEQKPRVLGAN